MKEDQNLIISANPGSGKTEELSSRVANSLKQGMPYSNILCITFTNKARDQMEQRIRKKLGDDSRLSLPEVHTFHSLAASILAERGMIDKNVPERYMRYMVLKYLNKNQLLNYDAEVLLKKYPTIINVGQIVNAIKFLKSYGLGPDSINTDVLKKNIENKYANNEGVNGYSCEELTTFADGFKNIFLNYEKSKKIGELDYNDLLTMAVKVTANYFKKYEIVFVDEVQDMSEIEFELVKNVSNKIFAVGDFKQAIFGFQGGNIIAYNKMISDSSFSKMYLEGTRRLPENVKEYCKNFFQLNEPSYNSPELERFNSLNKREGKVELIQVNDENTNESILNLVKNLNPNESMGIIVRTNEQANEVSDILNLNGIKHQQISGSMGADRWRREISQFLSGILGSSEDVVGMLYSVYSGIDLREAIIMADKLRFSSDIKSILPSHLFKLREIYGKSKTKIKLLFAEYILPFSIKLGREAYETAVDIYNTIDYFLDRFGVEDNLTLKDLQYYILQENTSTSNDELEERISVITVHKAKGLEFENVVYIPKYIERTKISAIDLLVNGILDQRGLTYGLEERKSEENRIDFVALSRTMKNLTILINKKFLNRYSIAPSKITSEPVKTTVNEFISLNEIVERESKKERGEPWLKDYIKKKMQKFNNLSFTMLSKTEDIEGFITSYILGIQTTSSALTFGTKVHKYIEDYINGGTVPAIMSDEKEMKTWSNFISYDRFIKETQKGKWIGSEMKFKQKVSLIYPEIKTELTIDGRIDGLYSYRDGEREKTVIVDFKTSKKENRDYAKQLSLYAKLFSVTKDIDMDKIESEIAYLSLRDEKVNTGKIGKKFDRIQSVIEIRALGDVKKMVEKFIQYKTSTSALVRDIIGIKNPQSNIFKKIQEILSEES
jgi:DNA helicase-2/ATP-dependent DNA helicase PcrA